MAESKHTPGPLTTGPAHVVKRVFNLPAPDGRRCIQFIAEFHECGKPSSVDPVANAARMTLTWNCHDDLVAALRQAEVVIGIDHPDGETIKVIRAAISKAEGRS